MFHLAVTSCLLLVVLTRSLHIVGVSRLGNNVSQFAEELSSTGVIYSPRQLVSVAFREGAIMAAAHGATVPIVDGGECARS